MAFTQHRGQDIHHTVEGEGPLVVFQHGLLGSAESWRQLGYVAALSDRYQVACVDSLGHGQSAKPADPALYHQQQRAGDIVAVMDALGAETAHVVGYSMGGWIVSGLAKFFPGRLASLTIGGWDLLHGLETARLAGAAGPSSLDALLETTREVAPALVAWVTPDVEPGLRACWDALHDLEGAADAVARAPFPVMLWNGRDDSPHAGMQAFAAAHGLQFLSTAGDHLSARFQFASEGADGIQAFIRANSH